VERKSFGIGLFALVATVVAAYSGHLDSTTWRIVVGGSHHARSRGRVRRATLVLRRRLASDVRGRLARQRDLASMGAIVGGVIAFLLFTPAINRAEGLA
jgi:hypothetical protein